MSELMKQEKLAEIVPIREEAITPMGILQMAISQGADIDKLTKLMELQERWEANEARKAFNDALATFKENPPQIIKNKHVKFTTQKGTTEYNHATLDHVCDQVTKGLAAVGIAHKWRPSQDGNKITVTCILTHRLGHSEETSLSSLPDDSGGKNALQGIGSAVSYLERYTLMAATGIASGMPDNDGRRVDDPARAEMPLADFDRVISLIEAAESLAMLQVTFAEGYKTAQKVGDKAAMKQFIEAKDKRKAEINEGR